MGVFGGATAPARTILLPLADDMDALIAPVLLSEIARFCDVVVKLPKFTVCGPAVTTVRRLGTVTLTVGPVPVVLPSTLPLLT